MNRYFPHFSLRQLEILEIYLLCSNSPDELFMNQDVMPFHDLECVVVLISICIMLRKIILACVVACHLDIL
jgi:hypothetical protein